MNNTIVEKSILIVILPPLKASPALDRHLVWDLFGLRELDAFEAMLNRLFRDELEELVMK